MRILTAFLILVAAACSCIREVRAADCDISTEESLSTLTERQALLQRQLSVDAAAVVSARNGTAMSGEDAAQALDRALAALTATSGSIECAQAKIARVHSLGHRTAEQVEKVLHYATNRELPQRSNLAKLSFGRATIAAPAPSERVLLSAASIIDLYRTGGMGSHSVKGATALSRDEMRADMIKTLSGLNAQSVLIYIHGYSSGFDDAAIRASQLSHDIRFGGLLLLFSWPSPGSAASYWQAEETALLSEEAFEQLLIYVTELPVSNIHIVAAGMGTRIASRAIVSFVHKGRPTEKLREVVLAAPDINVELFRTIIAPVLAGAKGTRTTIYASSGDLSLRASKIVHGSRRAGETSGGLMVFPGIDTIDASKAQYILRSYGHSQILDTAQVLDDLQAVIVRNDAAERRGLLRMGTAPNSYWHLKADGAR